MAKIDQISLRQLHSLAVVAQAGQITAAAQLLNLTPAAVTIQIKQLEATLGTSLFERTPSGFRRTDAGRELVNTAHRIQGILADSLHRIDHLIGLKVGTAKIGIVSTAKYFLPQLIAGFGQTQPNLKITLNVGNRLETIEALENYSVDLAIMGRPPQHFGVDFRSFGEHPLVMIASPDNPWAERKKPISSTELYGETFIMREKGSGTRNSFEGFMPDVFENSNVTTIEIGSNETIKQAVMAGLGISFISAHTISHEVAARRLSVINIKGLPITRKWYVVWRSDRALSPAAMALKKFVVEKGESYLPTI